MQKFYITTSIAYTNAPPHIGHALEYCQADVLARYWRLKLGDENVFFLTGTDEHGQKIFEAAQKAGKEPQEFVNEISGQFKSLCEKLGVSNNGFIRTTDREKHWPGVDKIWKNIAENGDLEKRKYQGLYCVGCEAFKTAKELINDNECPIHLKKVEVVEEENWFFKLSKYSSVLKEKIEKDEMKVVPESRRNEILSLLNQGLEDISFSRPKEKLPWGIPVPGDDSQMIYVWGDALTNYITGLGYGSSDETMFNKFWPADIHLIGKDILRFHAAIWPAMLLSAGLETPKGIMVHGFITSGGQKMSKSLGNVVSPFDLIEKYGSEAVRYYLLREIPTLDDGDFTEEKFIERYNSDLANGLGNLVSRMMTMAASQKIVIDIEKVEKRFLEEIKIEGGNQILPIGNYKENLENLKINKALEEIQNRFQLESSNAQNSQQFSEIWVSGSISSVSALNKEINEEKTYEEINTEGGKEKFKKKLERLCEIALMLSPFLPQTSEKILTAIKIGQKPENLFPRLK